MIDSFLYLLTDIFFFAGMQQGVNLMVTGAPLYPSQVQSIGLPMNGQQMQPAELHDMSTGGSRSMPLPHTEVSSLNMSRHHITTDNHSPFSNPPSQSQSPHLPNSSTLNRQITQT